MSGRLSRRRIEKRSDKYFSTASPCEGFVEHSGSRKSGPRVHPPGGHGRRVLASSTIRSSSAAASGESVISRRPTAWASCGGRHSRRTFSEGCAQRSASAPRPSWCRVSSPGRISVRDFLQGVEPHGETASVLEVVLVGEGDRSGGTPGRGHACSRSCRQHVDAHGDGVFPQSRQAIASLWSSFHVSVGFQPGDARASGSYPPCLMKSPRLGNNVHDTAKERAG